MPAHSRHTRPPTVEGIARILCLALGAVPALAAQEPPRPDTVRTRRDTLEAVVIKAVRAASATPAAQHTVVREAITKAFVGQDAPLFLTSTPSMTSYSEAGGYSGYSYVRLRGIDQTRLNITLDGVPLNDPEDQVLYFSNVPDFLNSMHSVQIQRGVGPSTFGTASYGGSLTFQSVPLALTPRGGAVELTGGSFNTARVSAQYNTGVLEGGWAAYARASKRHTDGYRHHSGNDAQSAFVSGGWFGKRDVVKFTGFAGVSGTRLAWLASSEADLAADRRVNPLSAAEGDRFHQEMASVQYARVLAEGATLSATAYRNSAAGAYDVAFSATETGNFYLAHVWHGLLTALSVTRGRLALDVGAHVSDYHREHALAMRPTLTQRAYTNVGFKQEQSAFAKVAFDVEALGTLRVSADVQARRAAFQYHPDANAGIGEVGTSWTFANPKAGLSWRPRAKDGTDSPLTLHASFSRTSREPARGDLFAGADDLNSQNASDLLPLTRVLPEKANDYEAGATWGRGAVALSANAFVMRFRDEIAPIGALALTGNPLRQNVPASYRRGVELDGRWRASDRLTASGNLTIMRSRILAWTDGRTGRTYVNVEQLMTPPVIANARGEWRLTDALWLAADARYVDRAYLANDRDARFIVPPWWMLDGALTWRSGRAEVRAHLFNALNHNAYAGGYTDGSSRYFYPLATRNLLVSTRYSF